MKVVIWGAGKFGRYIKKQLGTREDISLIGFIDANMDNTKEIDGLRIITLSQAREQHVDLVLVAILDYLSVFVQLMEENVEGIGVIKSRVYTLKQTLSSDLYNDSNILWIKDIKKLQKPFLTHLETNIMDSCNLNCKGCSHFSNLFEKDAHISYEVFCRDLQQIAKHTYIVSLYLLGGEALLNQQLIDYMEFSRKILPSADIQIVSNGLLIPKQSEEFFSGCKKNDISISISGYKPTLLMKEEIKNILERHQVEYSFKDDILTFGKNIDLQGKANPEVAIRRCREKACHFFRNGKLYKCPFEALGNHMFSYYKIDMQFDGGIDIYDTTLDWNEMIMRLDSQPVDSCCYCGEEERMDWEVANQPRLEDWIIRR